MPITRPRILSFTALTVSYATVSAVLVSSAVAVQPADTTVPAARAVATSSRSVPASQRLTFYFGLKRQDSQAQSALLAMSDPRSDQYLQHFSKSYVAGQFGASPATVRAVSQRLRALNLRSSLDPSRVFVRVRGTAAAFEKAFKTTMAATVNTHYTIISPTTPPAVPRELRALAPQRIWQSLVQNSTTVPSPTPPTPPPAPLSPLPVNTGTPIRYCSTLAGDFTYAMTFQQAITAYGLDRIKQQAPAGRLRGDIARRPPIGILAMGSGFSNQMLAFAANCFRWRGSFVRQRSDGMTSALPELGGEGDLDTQMVGAIAAKNWRVPVYEGLSSDVDPGQFLTPAKAFADPATPSVLTSSYGVCERSFRAGQGRMIREVADALYVRLGLVGTSVLVASGDAGSSVCTYQGGPVGQSLSYPASSPWVTAVGGSQISFTSRNSRKSERVWNSWRNSQPGEPTTPLIIGAGTGGPSAIYPRPAWQRGYLPNIKRRTVPDITANAAFGPSWITFSHGDVRETAGTSASTPFNASGIALINARRMTQGRAPLGFLNPMLYSLPKRSFYDVTQGTNDLWDVGCCLARPGYDMTSGRGAVRFDIFDSLVFRR